METKLITDVATEPLNLNELKNHLRLDYNNYANSLSTSQSIIPQDGAVGNITGTGVDRLGYKTIVNLNAGLCQAGATLDVKIQESDDDSTYVDWHSFTQVTTANDEQLFEKEYTGSKQYVRCYATIANDTVEFSCEVILSNYSEEDTQLTAFIKAAREFGEDYTGNAFATQTWEMYLDDFPECDRIDWFFNDLQSISVTVKDNEGNTTVLTENTHYIVDITPGAGGVFLPYGESWYDFIPYHYNAVIIRGVCGYTDIVPNVLPHNYKQAMLLHAGYMYKFRDTAIPADHMQTIYNIYGMRRHKTRWF